MPAPRQDARYRIADAIRSKIESGEYPAGELVPSETQLAQEYGVAKMTARSALEVLKAEGLVIAQQGRGTRVREFNPIRRRASTRLSAEVWQAGNSIWSADTAGRRPEVDQMQVEENPAGEHVARALGLTPGEPVCVRSRRHVLDGKPVLISTSYLPAALVSGTPITVPDSGPGGIYARLAELDHAPVRFTEELRSRMPLQAEAAQLELPGNTPIIQIVRTAYAANGTAVEVNDMTLDASAYVLEYDFDA
jgi:GntR family transcriptional regulator